MFEKSFFSLDKKPLYIFSGEIHYFRIKPEKWDIHLQRAKQAGLNTVSTYIPWCWHEYEEGKTDFAGKTHPRRDLEAYIEKVKENDLYLFVRIGPFSNAELKGEGIPSWMYEKYPEIYTTGEGIENLPHTNIVSYINPKFREKTKKWYEKVIPVVEPHQYSKGGNIILTQLCNEIGMIHWVNGTGDYSGIATREYQKFLKEKYKKIENLNKVYKGSNFKQFNQIKQPALREVYGWRDYWDWSEYYREYFADYYDFLQKFAVKKGINTPLTANIPQFIDFDVRGRGFASPMTTSFYKKIPDKKDKVILGGAYQMRRLDFENFHDVDISTQVIKSVYKYKMPVICAEMQTGIMRDRPRLYPSDVELNLKTSLGAGVNGVNCYMFSGGENPDNIGMFGKSHQWQAPVSSEGETKDHYNTIKEHGEFIKTFGRSIAQSKPVFDTAVGIYPPYYATEFVKNECKQDIVNARNRYFFDGIGRLLRMGGFNYKILDLIEDEINPDNLDTLWIFSYQYMDISAQNKILKYVEKGGKAVIFPEFPTKDLSGEKATKIIDELGIRINGSINPETVDYYGKEYYIEGSVQNMELDDKVKVLGKKDEKIVSFAKNYKKGKFVFLGTPMPHYYDYQVNLIENIAEQELDIIREIKINNDDIIGNIRKGDKGSFIFLMNYHLQDHNINLNIEDNDRKTINNIYIKQRTAKILPYKLEILPKIIVNYCTAEILSFSDMGKELEFKFRGYPGKKERISLGIHGEEKETGFILKKMVEKVRIKK